MGEIWYGFYGVDSSLLGRCDLSFLGRGPGLYLGGTYFLLPSHARSPTSPLYGPLQLLAENRSWPLQRSCCRNARLNE